MSTDWLPGKRGLQLAMAKTWVSVLEEMDEKWKIPAIEKTALRECLEYAEVLIARAMAQDRNPIITSRCNEAFKKFIREMRRIKNHYFLDPPLIESDFVSLGLRPRDTIKTPIPTPTGQAIAEVSYPGVGLLTLHLKPVEGTIHNKRAEHGYRIYFGIMPAGGASVEDAAGLDHYLMKPAVTGDQLPHSKFSRRSKVLLEFSAKDSGKTVFFSIRFENAKGDQGPWGPVFSAVIP